MYIYICICIHTHIYIDTYLYTMVIQTHLVSKAGRSEWLGSGGADPWLWMALGGAVGVMYGCYSWLILWISMDNKGYISIYVVNVQQLIRVNAMDKRL